MSDIVIGFFGCGRMGQLHLQGFLTDPRCRIAYIFDPVDEIRESVKKQFPDLLHRHKCVFVNNDEKHKVFEDKSVQAVVICTPTIFHDELITAALEHGKHVMTEKPVKFTGLLLNADLVTSDAESTQKCYELARSQNRYLFCAYTRRFDVHYRKMIDGVKKGDIGKVHLLRLCSRDPALGKVEKADWANANGNVFLDFMIHDIDMTLHLVGETPKTIFAHAYSHHSQMAAIGEWDTATLTMTFPSGAVAYMDCARQAVYGYDNRVEVFGDGGMFVVPSPHVTLTSHWTKAGAHFDRVGDDEFYLNRWKQPLAAEDKHFVDFLDGKAKPYDFEKDAVLGAKIAAAATESALKNVLIHL